MPMGLLGSPDVDMDGHYEPRLDCTWTIEMPINRAINLTFSSFDLESSSTCHYDSVKVKTQNPSVDMVKYASVESENINSIGKFSKSFK